MGVWVCGSVLAQPHHLSALSIAVSSPLHENSKSEYRNRNNFEA
jgi:hypothetical protein